MATNVTKLVNEVADFINRVNNLKIVVEDISKKLEKNISCLREQTSSYCISKKAHVPRSILKIFPDVKERLLCNLNCLIDEEITEMNILTDQLLSYSLELKKRCDKIQKLMSRINWKEHVLYLNAFFRIYRWTENCWKYLHFIYISVQDGILSIRRDEEHSFDHIKCIDMMADMTKDDIFNNVVIDMFDLLKIDLASREKVKDSLSLGTSHCKSHTP